MTDALAALTALTDPGVSENPRWSNSTPIGETNLWS